MSRGLLTGFIVSSFKQVIDLALWFMLAVGIVSGIYLGEKTFGNGWGGIVAGAVVGGAITYVLLTIIFGAVLLLVDVHGFLEKIESHLKAKI